MGIVHVAHLKPGPVTGKTARPERRQTPFVRQLAQRVVLIHKLRKLGGAEELLDRRGNRLDINQTLRRNPFQILRRHTLAHHAFQTGKPDTVLVLQKLAYRTDTAVAQMVNIIVMPGGIFQMHIVVDGCKYIVFGDMLRNQIRDILADRFLDILQFAVFFQNLC